MISKARLQEIKELLSAAADGSTGIVGLTSVVRVVPELLDEVERIPDLEAALAKVQGEASTWFKAGCDGIDAMGEHEAHEVARLQGKVEFLEGCLRSRMEHARLSRGAARTRIAALEGGLREALLKAGGACAPGEDVDYDRLRALVPEKEH